MIIRKQAKEFENIVRVEPEVRPEYVYKLRKIHSGKRVKIGSVADFKKRYGLK